MPEQEVTVPIQLMGKNFSIKCPSSQVPQLEQSIAFLQRRLTQMRQNNNESNLEKLLFIAALNLVHDMVHGDENRAASLMNQQISDMITKIDKQLSHI